MLCARARARAHCTIATGRPRCTPGKDAGRPAGSLTPLLLLGGSAVQSASARAIYTDGWTRDTRTYATAAVAAHTRAPVSPRTLAYFFNAPCEILLTVSPQLLFGRVIVVAVVGHSWCFRRLHEPRLSSILLQSPLSPAPVLFLCHIGRNRGIRDAAVRCRSHPEPFSRFLHPTSPTTVLLYPDGRTFPTTIMSPALASVPRARVQVSVRPAWKPDAPFTVRVCIYLRHCSRRAN